MVNSEFVLKHCLAQWVWTLLEHVDLAVFTDLFQRRIRSLIFNVWTLTKRNPLSIAPNPSEWQDQRHSLLGHPTPGNHSIFHESWRPRRSQPTTLTKCSIFTKVIDEP